MLYGSVVGVFLLGLWAYCVFDVIRTDASLCENLPKPLWLLIVLFVPTIGSLAWLLLGRPGNASFNLRGNPVDRRALPRPPESLPPAPDPAAHERWREDVLRRHQAEREEAERRREAEVEALRLQAWEQELRRREEALRRKDQEGNGRP